MSPESLRDPPDPPHDPGGGTPAVRREGFAATTVEQIAVAAEVARGRCSGSGLLADRLGAHRDDLEVRAIAAAIVAAVWVAIEEWQAQDGRDGLGELVSRALSVVVVGSGRATAARQRRAAR
jgi:hypothetical protein